ncbi:hypothetical protein WMY93_009119 [Mugilogobius chulae]|uniref:Calponin-homology (CH) domain-containing protein n=1 Tax=Mugilogobius chulae TaxID=88201 RepID=A0AAW0PDX4_9GOBI
MSGLRTALPREVLLWLHNLQLSLAHNNVRRDFSNGYLVAEILSRFYPKVFLLYSYKNGAGLSIKLDNWRRIQKFSQKLNINLSQDLINATINLEMGAAEKLLTEIYIILTKQSPDFARSLRSYLRADRERTEVLLPYKHQHCTELPSSSPGPATALYKEIKVKQPIKHYIQQ